MIVAMESSLLIGCGTVEIVIFFQLVCSILNHSVGYGAKQLSSVHSAMHAAEKDTAQIAFQTVLDKFLFQLNHRVSG